jgi:hypothetical protein
VQTIDEATKRRLSVEAECDPRTLLKVLRGERVRGAVCGRIRTVLDRHGLRTDQDQASADPSAVAERMALRTRVDALETTIAAGGKGTP